MEYIKYVLFGLQFYWRALDLDRAYCVNHPYRYRNGMVSPWTFYKEYNQRQHWLKTAQDRANEDSLRSHYAFERSQRAFERKLKKQREDRYGI